MKRLRPLRRHDPTMIVLKPLCHLNAIACMFDEEVVLLGCDPGRRNAPGRHGVWGERSWCGTARTWCALAGLVMGWGSTRRDMTLCWWAVVPRRARASALLPGGTTVLQGGSSMSAIPGSVTGMGSNTLLRHTGDCYADHEARVLWSCARLGKPVGGGCDDSLLIFSSA